MIEGNYMYCNFDSDFDAYLCNVYCYNGLNFKVSSKDGDQDHFTIEH